MNDFITWKRQYEFINCGYGTHKALRPDMCKGKHLDPLYSPRETHWDYKI